MGESPATVTETLSPSLPTRIEEMAADVLTALCERGWRVAEKKRVAEGFAINFAKRVETASRLGCASGIALSQSFYGLCRQSGFPILVGDPLGVEAKGFDHHEPVFEVVAQDVVRSHEPFAASGVTALL